MKTLTYKTPRRTERISKLQEALAFRTHLMSEQMIADWLFDADVRRVRSVLKPFTQCTPQQLCTQIVYAQEIPLAPPAAEWRPGSELPDYRKAARFLQTRSVGPTRAIRVYWASPYTANRLGGFGTRKLGKTLQCTHDLHMSAIWLMYLKTAPELAAKWRSEEWLRRRLHCASSVGIGAGNTKRQRRPKLPDAGIFDGNRLEFIVESGGKYPPKRVQAFFNFCAKRRWPFKLY